MTNIYFNRFHFNKTTVFLLIADVPHNFQIWTNEEIPNGFIVFFELTFAILFPLNQTFPLNSGLKFTKRIHFGGKNRQRVVMKIVDKFYFKINRVGSTGFEKKNLCANDQNVKITAFNNANMFGLFCSLIRTQLYQIR